MKNKKSGNANNYLVNGPPGGLFWPELIKGTLIKRYKRFLADIRLENGEIVTAHCANSGRMTTCSTKGQPVYLSLHDRPERKLKYTWEMIEMPDSLVGVNTQVPNRLVKKAIIDGEIPEISGYSSVISEKTLKSKSRIDLLCQAEGRRDCYIEIKNCTLVKDGRACFPDAVTKRGQKHLDELTELARTKRCMMFFLVQRMDAASFSPAGDIDPEYAEKLKTAVSRGVIPLCYDTFINTEFLKINKALPVEI